MGGGGRGEGVQPLLRTASQLYSRPKKAVCARVVCLPSDNAGDVAHRARGGAAHRLQPCPCERLTLSISTAAVTAPQHRRHHHAHIPGGGRASASLNRSRTNTSISSSVSPWPIRKVCIRIVSPMMELESHASRRAKHALASDITPRLGAFLPDGRCHRSMLSWCWQAGS